MFPGAAAKNSITTKLHSPAVAWHSKVWRHIVKSWLHVSCLPQYCSYMHDPRCYILAYPGCKIHLSLHDKGLNSTNIHGLNLSSSSKGAVCGSKHGLQLSQPNLGWIHPGFFVVHVISVAAQTDKHRKCKAILGLAVPTLYVRLAGKLTGPNVKCLLKESYGALNMNYLQLSFKTYIYVFLEIWVNRAEHILVQILCDIITLLTSSYMKPFHKLSGGQYQ